MWFIQSQQFRKWQFHVAANSDTISKVLVWDAVSEVWEVAGYLDTIQYYPAALEVKIDDLAGYC